MLTRCKSLSDLSVEATVHCQRTDFANGLLFTHRGLSDPSMPQISSYWNNGMPLMANLVPCGNIAAALKAGKRQTQNRMLLTSLSHYLPKRLAADICRQAGMESGFRAQNKKRFGQLGEALNK